MSGLAIDIPGGAAKLITCVLPDNGMDRQVLRMLREEWGITRAHSVHCRGVAVLQAAKAPRDKVPEAALARVLSVVVDAQQADEVFDFICVQAGLNQPDSGSVYMTALHFATPLTMPAGVPEEARAKTTGL
ncbi:hypothetical protein LRS11_09870 [Pseudomonas sp. J452]|uniref:hypothetical protein n=1 Tax=Pseudomonas sp. J452 TaxID=2898441 RepID=UPI0021ADCFEC|nr:hypothetical protein [Pseudomonas sp. J452]UUY10304.1 hypothetical protein LRS11_09870 [Pseudomonas sp. J452]